MRGNGDDENELTDPPRPFLEHLEELRAMVLKIGFTIILSTVLAFVFIRQIFQLLQRPLVFAGLNPEDFLRNLAPVGGFTTAMQMAVLAGGVVALPLVLFFVAEFVLPAFTRTEKRVILPVFAGGAALFVAGVAFAYFVLIPVTLKFFYEFDRSLGFISAWTVQNYIGFVVQLLLVMGLVFELPVVILTLAALGLVDSFFLRKYRSHAIVFIVVLAAVITPTSDLITLSMVSVPMWLLYELCVLITWLLECRTARG
jgi:sec-independent protein translocase protein TatC